MQGITEPSPTVSFDASAPEAARFRVLAVDDEPEFLRGLGRVLGPRGFDVVGHGHAAHALDYLQVEHAVIDVMLIDRTLATSGDGFEVLTRARAITSDVSLIMLTGDQRDSTSATALRLGAFHFITKPILDFDAVTLTLLRAAHFSRLQRRARSLEQRIGLEQRFEKMVGNSPAMRALYLRMSKVAETDLSVLIQGESGTGKELVARGIHDRSKRARAPFVGVNCSAIPEALIDSELFGHTKGAFTGAAEARAGVFVEAHDGTLLLDEVGELSPAVQSRLLRVLQEHEVRPLGASGTRQVDVRVIAASHVDLDELVKAKLFRADLFYRLNVVAVRIPPLRARTEDIPLLVIHLVNKHAALMKRAAPRLSQALLQALTRYPWPGNVRELENTLQCILALSSGSSLDVDSLPPQLEAALAELPIEVARIGERITSDATSELEDYKTARRHSIEAFDHAYFVDLLKRSGGNVSEASRLSGMDRSNLRRALAKAGLRAIPPSDDEPEPSELSS